METHTYVIRDYYGSGGYWSLLIQGDSVLRMDSVSAQPNVHGFGHHLVLNDKTTFCAYFSTFEGNADLAPEYSKSLRLVLGSRVFGDTLEQPLIHIEQKFSSRVFSALSNGSVVFKQEYPWPWYREIFKRIMSDPFNFESKDFSREMLELLKVYRPQWIAH